MQVKIDKFVGECPQFNQYTPVTRRSLLSENHEIRRLKPTELSQNRVLLAIQRIFQRFLNWLFPTEHTNYTGIVAALDRNSEKEPNMLVLSDLFGYIQRFFRSEKNTSPNLNRCLSQLQDQAEAIKKYCVDKSNSDEERFGKEKKAIRDRWNNEIRSLKDGQQCMVIAKAEPKDEVFLLFSKNNGQLSLKIIGRGASMVGISGIEEVAVTGRAKIVSCVSYGNIDQQLIDDALEHTQFGTKAVGDQEFLDRLKDHQIEEHQPANLASQTNNILNVFWTAFEHVQKNDGKTVEDCKRAKLRLEIFTLFSALKEYRHTMLSNPFEVQTVGRMLRLCSQHLAEGHEAGLVSTEEINEFVKEITCVQNLIDLANRSEKTSLSSLGMPSMDIYDLKPLSSLQAPVVVPAPGSSPVANPRSPVLSLPEAKGADIVRQPVQSNVHLPIPDRLKALTIETSPQKIIEAIYDIPFVPFKKDGKLLNEEERKDSSVNWVKLDATHREFDQESDWHKLTVEQSKEMMDMLNVLSKRLADWSLAEGELPIDAYEALIKMSYMVVYLQEQRVQAGEFVTESYTLTHDILKRFGNKLSSRNFYEEGRVGASLHSGNTETNEQLHQFQKNYYSYITAQIYLKHCHRKMHVDLSRRLEGFHNLQTQVDILSHLMPHFKNHYNDEFTSVPSSVYSWTPPLPIQLLATYHKVGIEMSWEGRRSRSKEEEVKVEVDNRSFNIWRHKSRENPNRDMPEAIRHDPFSTLRHYETDFMTDDVLNWRKSVKEELNSGRHNVYLTEDLALIDSPYFGEPRKAQLKRLLKKQEEYILRSKQMELNLSQDELTAVLSLLRADKPQTVVLGFLQANAAMLANPVVRTIVQLMLFHPTLISSLEDESFCKLMPRFLSEKIEEYKKKASESSSAIPVLLFFLQTSERLKGVYEVLKKNDTFYAVGSDEMQSFLKTCRSKDLASAANHEIAVLQLKVLFAKPSLTQEEVCQIMLDMHMLSTATHQHSIDFREIFWLKSKYESMMKDVGNCLDQPHLQYVLDTLCHKKGLILDNSLWEGSFPVFFNAQYSVDLVQGIVTDRSTETVSTALPDHILSNPMFRNTFSDISWGNMKVMASTLNDGCKVYFFKDQQQNPCRIEERNGVCSFYRAFSKDGKLLQAVSFVDKEVEKDPVRALNLHRAMEVERYEQENISKIYSQLTAKWKEKVPELPALLQQRLFIDPQDLLKGYIVSPENEIQLEVTFEKAFFTNRTYIKHVVDLRAGKPSEPMQLVGLDEIGHNALQQLKQIEESAHILAWGRRGTVEKIELPRYGMQFVMKDGELICTDPLYAGYKINLSASLGERKGFAFSLLLEHSDRSYPKKLILPPAASIIAGEKDMPYYGLAYVFWIIKSVLNFLIFNAQPHIISSVCLKIDSSKQSINPVVVNLRPHTNEISYASGKAAEQSQQLILQAMKLGDYELALEMLRQVEIENDDGTIKQWQRFLSEFHQSPHAAAIGLKIAEKLLDRVEGQNKYKELCRALYDTESGLFKEYLKESRKMTPQLRLSRSVFERISNHLKKHESIYYQKHVAPYFLQIGDRFSLPITTITGELNGLPQIIPSHAEERQKELSTIRRLEDKVQPQNQLDRSALSRSFTILAEPVPLVFEQDAFIQHFNSATKELLSGRELLAKLVHPKLKAIREEKEKAQIALHQLLHNSTEAIEQLAIHAKTKRIATLSDLHLALLQNDFQGLKDRGLLPNAVTCEQLKSAVIKFYDLEVKLHSLLRCETEINSMLTEKSKLDAVTWTAKSKVLFDLLNYRRQYNSTENPELLAFEAFHFVTFRNSPSQLELLQQLLQAQSSIVQAGTGSGKSSVLSVLRGFMRANGTNLVTQKVLPHLYQETVAILQARLGDTFKRKVYPLLFNQSMPLYDKEGNSLFEGVYLNLLETIKNKGVVLTDYKSFVLLEEKLLSLSNQLSIEKENGIVSSPVLIRHWFYLVKIINLLKNRDDQLMDEFDGPMSAVQRIQTQIKEGPLFDRWMINEALALYDLLEQEESLLMSKNLQGEISAQARQEGLNRVAHRIAGQKVKGDASSQHIYDYITGKNEEVLNRLTHWSPEEKDSLVFLKDEFTSYLTLTLGRSGGSHYARSKDGKKIVVCAKGEKRDAKFGNQIEEINYTIQDYIQQKVDFATLRAWVLESKKDWASNSQAAEKRFQDVLPGVSIGAIAYLSPDEFETRIGELLSIVNQSQAAIRFFLKRHLESLRASGMVISMNPQDSVAMSCAVSGISATTGSLGSLHEQFQKDLSAAEKIQNESIERINRRSYGEPIRYNPHAPLDMLRQVQGNPRLCAIIDGNGAFRAIPPGDVARALMQANPALKRVDYYDVDGTVATIGDKNASLSEKGFYFPEAQTRGSDQVLRPDGLFLMTAAEKGDIEDFIQEAGRARHDDQKLLVVLSDFASADLKTLKDILSLKKENEKAKNAEDRYRAEFQRLRQMNRYAARQELLKTPDLDRIQQALEAPNVKPEEIQNELTNFFNRFKQLKGLFIQNISAEDRPGDYFEKHKKIVQKTPNAVQELKNYQAELIKECTKLGLTCPDALTNYNADVLGSELPKYVLPYGAAESSQQEVQEELELNNQLLVEQEQDMSQERECHVSDNKVESYLPRLNTTGKTYPANTIHSSFSAKIEFTDPYLPLGRTDPIHKRKLFDDRTARIGSVQVLMNQSGGIEKILVGDLLDEVDKENPKYTTFGGSSLKSFRYDIRLGKVTSNEGPESSVLLNSSEFKNLIAQIKFIDGMTDGYSDHEITELNKWVKSNGVENMQRYFALTVLKHRPEQRFPHSQLYTTFQSLIAR